MNKELAKTITTALVQFIDRERPEGTMDCSSAECESIEEMFEGECFNMMETFIQKKLSRLTEFEQEVSDMVEYCKEHGEHVAFDYAKRHAQTLLTLAKEELLKELPRWERDDSIEAEQYITVGKNGERFHYKGHSLLISDLVKLPGFKED